LRARNAEHVFDFFAQQGIDKGARAGGFFNHRVFLFAGLFVLLADRFAAA
jgi:hypothetical protein